MKTICYPRQVAVLPSSSHGTHVSSSSYKPICYPRQVAVLPSVLLCGRVLIKFSLIHSVCPDFWERTKTFLSTFFRILVLFLFGTKSCKFSQVSALVLLQKDVPIESSFFLRKKSSRGVPTHQTLKQILQVSALLLLQ
jgi:hypothetical protein